LIANWKIKPLMVSLRVRVDAHVQIVLSFFHLEYDVEVAWLKHGVEPKLFLAETRVNTHEFPWGL
jgi:hypothetical protein